VPAIVRLDHAVEEMVHLKVHGTFRTIDDKPSLTLNFKSSFLGLSRIHLNNSLDDRTYIQEKLGSEIFAANGVPAPRVGHARVVLNGRPLGLYVLKEGFTPDFLARSYPSGKGELFEQDVSPLREAVQMQDFTKLEAKLPMDQFISFIATEVLICHWDGYATAGNNFKIYQALAEDLYHFLPTGMDQLFGNPVFPAVPDMTGLVARALMQTMEGQRRFQTRLRKLASAFDGRKWAERAKALAHGLGSEVDRKSLVELCQRIEARDAFLDGEVDALLRNGP
jgi:spore coat protein H